MIAMVILNYNDWELTRSYALTVSAMKVVDHIVIVDNCSPDGSYENLKDLSSDKIDVIKTDSNEGYARGNNFGVQYVSECFGPDGIVIISNPDIEVSEQAVKEIVSALENDGSLFAATGLIYNARDRLIPIFTWHLPTVPVLFVNSCTILRNVLYKLFGYGTKIQKDKVDFRQPFIMCEALPGCFFAADLQKWNELGGFCSRTFLFFEEDILFSKARDRGMKCALVPSAKVRHLEGVSVKKSLNSWRKRELLLQDSCGIYMQEALHRGKGTVICYKIWNQLWLPERYLFYRLKKMG